MDIAIEFGNMGINPTAPNQNHLQEKKCQDDGVTRSKGTITSRPGRRQCTSLYGLEDEFSGLSSAMPTTAMTV